MSDWPKSVATTIRPDEPVYVDEAEYRQLDMQGLLVDSATPRPIDATAAPARRTTADKEA